MGMGIYLPSADALHSLAKETNMDEEVKGLSRPIELHINKVVQLEARKQSRAVHCRSRSAAKHKK